AGLRWPAPFVSLDPVYFNIWVTEGTWHNARWHLTLWLFERLAALLHRVAGALSVIRVVNALVVTVALLAFVGAARRLGRTRGEVRRRRDGRSRIAAVGAAALAAAGAATLPYYGRPLAWWAFLDDLQRSNVTELGLSPTSILLPPRYLVGATHAQELLHTAMLLDPVGWLLLLIAGG